MSRFQIVHFPTPSAWFGPSLFNWKIFKNWEGLQNYKPGTFQCIGIVRDRKIQKTELFTSLDFQGQLCTKTTIFISSICVSIESCKIVEKCSTQKLGTYSALHYPETENNFWKSHKCWLLSFLKLRLLLIYYLIFLQQTSNPQVLSRKSTSNVSVWLPWRNWKWYRLQLLETAIFKDHSICSNSKCFEYSYRIFFNQNCCQQLLDCWYFSHVFTSVFCCIGILGVQICQTCKK